MNPKRVLVIGDSFVEGVGAPENKGWAYLLQNLFPDQQIYISGVGGDTSEKILDRFPADDFDYYIIQIGTNDSRYRPSKKDTEIREITFKKNLYRLLSKIKNHSHIYFVGVLFVDERKTVPYKEDKVYCNATLRKFDNLIKDFCTSNNLHCISLEEMIGIKEYLSDGLHPSELGHSKIAQIVAKALESELRPNLIKKG